MFDFLKRRICPFYFRNDGSSDGLDEPLEADICGFLNVDRSIKNAVLRDA